MAQPTTPGETPDQPADATATPSTEAAAERADGSTTVQQAQEVRQGDREPVQERDAEIAPAPAEQPVAEPVAQVVEPPKRSGNRLAGTAWVLLASGVFEAVYLGLIALVVLVLAGPQTVGPQLAYFAATPFAWLPVLLFFLLFELTVLLVNRAGRFVYVVASLIVGIVVYVLSVLLISILLRGGIGDAATLQQSFFGWPFILIGLVAREVMLWTGIAIGARGTRVRRRNRAAKQRYQEEVADARA